LDDNTWAMKWAQVKWLSEKGVLSLNKKMDD